MIAILFGEEKHRLPCPAEPLTIQQAIETAFKAVAWNDGSPPESFAFMVWGDGVSLRKGLILNDKVKDGDAIVVYEPEPEPEPSHF